MSEIAEALKLSIADVAAGTTFVERRRAFGCRSGIELNERFQAHPNGPAFSAAGATGSVRIFSLDDAVLDGETLVLSKNGCVISESVYFASGQTASSEPTVEPLHSGQVLVVACNNQHWGYQHWLAQCVPAIDCSLRHLRSAAGGRVRDEDIVLLLPDLAPWQEDFLKLLGCSRLSRLRPMAGERYRLPRVVFCDYVNGSSSFDVTRSLMDTVRRLMNAVPVAPSSDKLLYVPNRTPYYGPIRNEEAAVALLRRYGVRVLEPERLGTAERINLFREAEAVIGPIGQYLADILFCRPGALLWEWSPEHHQNAMFNRLAQAAGVDYWGDMFGSVDGHAWDVDLDVISRRLLTLSRRPEPPPRPWIAPETEPAGLPLEDLLLRFESLGDNCEFGFVQRAAGVEPLGLLRFSGIALDPADRLPRLVSALERGFEGLGALETIQVMPEGIEGERELIVHETAFDLSYHTWVREDEATLELQAEREVKRLTFLRRKLMEDLAAGEKICVWKCDASETETEVRPLFEALRSLGPNTLLWVTLADEAHEPGSVEMIEPHFLRGYVRRFAPATRAMDVDCSPWFEVCQAALRLSGQPTEPVAEPAPSSQALVPIETKRADEGPLSAMDYLARGGSPTDRPTRKQGIFSALLRLFGR